MIDRSIDANAAVSVLDRLAVARRAPGFVRARWPRGFEFNAHAVTMAGANDQAHRQGRHPRHSTIDDLVATVPV